MFSDYILLSKGVSVLGLKTYARFLHNSSLVYNNINAKKHNAYCHPFAKISMHISARQKDDLICPVIFILLKTMNKRDITSCKG